MTLTKLARLPTPLHASSYAWHKHARLLVCVSSRYDRAKLTKSSNNIVAYVKFRTPALAKDAMLQMQGFVVQSVPLVTLDIGMARYTFA